MADREAILAALSQDLGGTRPDSRIATKTTPSGDLWNAFVQMLEFHKGEAIEQEILATFKSRAIYDDDLPTELKSLVGESINDPWSAEAGITSNALAIAETGSILISTSPQNRRLTSLAPPVHIALVDPSKTVASLDDGLAQLDHRTSVLVTGPSRTADVEGVIVMGVHGPKRLIVVPWPRKIPA